MVTKHTWPLQADARTFFGRPGDESNLARVVPPFAVYYEKQPVHSIRIHEKCATSLQEVLDELWRHYEQSQHQIDVAHCSLYSGSFADRTIRGSSKQSMHAYGVAIDMDAEHNPMTYSKTAGFFTPQSPIVQIFEAAGWIWGGRWSGRRDPMHFQAARIR